MATKANDQPKTGESKEQANPTAMPESTVQAPAEDVTGAEPDQVIGLHSAIASAAIDAQRSGDYALHAMLSDIEVASGALRTKIGAAIANIDGEVADLLNKLHALL